jgi:WD40 repeat protein
VSYSRRDSAFVSDLRQALVDHGRNVWIDADDIPPGAPWRRELGTAIEAANAFVFVISPDSVVSRECLAELERAVELNKRIVPVRHRDASGTPRTLLDLQLIEIASSGELPGRLEAVERALDLDHDWVRAHTHWGGRALRWAERGRDTSLLLRGRDLGTAEEWLALQAQGKRPRPTALQTDFIVSSRKAERRRLRTLIVAATAAVLVAVTLSITALIQRGVAVEQRDQAHSRELAANAVNQLEIDPERTLLLALESERVARTPQTVDALRRGLAASRVRATMRGHRAAVTRLFVSDDGRRIATGSRDGTVRLWDGRGRSVAVLRHDGPITGVAGTADGRLVVSASDDGTARVWDGRDGRRIAILRGHRGPVADARPDAHGRRVVTAGDDGTVRIWDALRGAERVVLRGHAGGVNSAAFSPDGGEILSAGEDHTLRVWRPGHSGNRVIDSGDFDADTVQFSARGSRALTTTLDGIATVWRTRTWRSQYTVDHVFSAALSANGAALVTTNIDGGADVWTEDEDQGTTLRGHGEAVLGAAFSADGKLVATSGVDNTARVWDAATGANLAVLRGHAGAVHRVAFMPDGRRLVTVSGDGTAKLWDTNVPVAFRGHGSQVGQGQPYQVTDVDVSPDGRSVLSSARDGTARVWEIATGREIFAPPGCTPLRGLEPGRWSCLAAGSIRGLSLLNTAAWRPDGRAVVIGGDVGGAAVLDAFTGRELTELAGHHDRVNQARFSPSGERIVTAAEDGARVWRARDGNQLLVLRGHGTPPGERGKAAVSAAAFSPDGRRIATAGSDGTIRVWDATTGRQLTRRHVHEGIVLDVDFSHDGTRITAPVGETARVWQIDGWREVAILRGHDGDVSETSYSRDGSLIVTGGYDGTARVWDATSGEPVAVFAGHTQTVLGARFSPDRRWVVTSSEDGTALVHRCEACAAPDELVRLAAARVTRALTPEERRRYLRPGAQ